MNEGRPTDRDSRRSGRLLLFCSAISMRRLIKSGPILALSAALAACQQTSPAPTVTAIPILDSSFHSCVDQEVKAAVGRAIEKNNELELYGHHTEIENDVISICKPQLRRETVQDNLNPTNPVYSFLNATVEVETQAAIKDKIRKEVDADGLPPEKWSSLRYGFGADGGHWNGEEETHSRGDCREASAG
jgi:hypothetical protein